MNQIQILNITAIYYYSMRENYLLQPWPLLVKPKLKLVDLAAS